ncbi:hypothetical protein [Bradyrhizobium sp.]|uniref:hypothetical protein n=1 Tax=Bradyrhizobium sp. TaxID=376 RepID=UPI002D519C76|nr:hypothetical protein [Bradyrhizobium sp.]HZR74537.1 hypothetical protein [Bradyrhizobium sp.]
MSFKTLVSREGADDHLIEFYKIPPEDWDHVRWNDSFFGHGILTYRRWDRARRIEEVRHFNVKFNPEHVKRVAAPYQAAQATLAAPPMEENKGPAISPAHLKAWFEFYKKIDGEMREDPAWDHARMCFPKNSITRQKIRDLLPDRPMGRPPKRET